MPHLFQKWANPLAKLSIVGTLIGIGVLSWAASLYFHSPFFTDRQVSAQQPVPFSHEHHVKGLGLDCRYCHTAVEVSSSAGMPATETCMTCHSQVWNQADVLAPVRQSYATGVPIRWIRLTHVPDYVYFDHSIHLNKGVGCVSCHGRVDEMPLTYKAYDMSMSWCLSCHRDPGPQLRPREAVFDLAWQTSEDRRVLGAQLMQELHVNAGHRLTNCSVCHR